MCTAGIQGVGSPAAFVLGGGVGVESVGYALTVSADGQTASTAACETFGSPSLAAAAAEGDVGGGGGGAGGQIAQVQVARLELILLTDVFAA